MLLNELQSINDRFRGAAPRALVRWAAREFRGDVAVSSSFQTQSVPLLHLISRTAPEIPVIFLDTGFHFPETLEFRDRIVEEFGLTLQVMKARMDRSEFDRRHGSDLYAHDPDLCCYIHKVEPMERALEGLEAWISGIRKVQTSARTQAQLIERTSHGVIRIHPILEWTQADLDDYRREHDLPEHPLAREGYASVGCAPCTRPVRRDEDARAGRWSGTDRTECGLHTDLRAPQGSDEQLIQIRSRRPGSDEGESEAEDDL